MKLTIVLLLLSSICFAQQIGTNQIKDAAVTQSKLGAASVSNPKIANGAVTEAKLADGSVTAVKMDPTALRPTDGGNLTNFELTFGPEYRRKYALAVTSDISLSLAPSGHTSDSYIFISTVPDGSHVVSFPSNWVIKNNGVFDPTQTQRIELYYDGNKVYVDIINDNNPIVQSSLVSGTVVGGTDDITLVFSNPVTITTAGWSFTASGGVVTVSSVVSGSGTASVVFDLSRNITAGETMTVSYDPSTGNTLSSTGNEIPVVSALIVDTGSGAIPPNSVFVDDDAVDDVAAGTAADPFKTGQAASNAATTGQTVLFRAGTYRETIVAKAGVTYQNYPGETAIISGLDVTGTTGWTVHSGNIYKKTITINGGNNWIDNNNTNTTLHANQIFKDGAMMIEARWPNVANVDELFDRTKLRQKSSFTGAGAGWTSTQITDSGLAGSLTSGNWIGGTIWINGWYISKTASITAQSGNTITHTNGTGDARFQQYYYLAGKLAALDIANEFFYDETTDILYLWQPGGGSPTGIEHKARNWGIDCRGKANVTIKGLTFKGCDPTQSDLSSANLMVDGIRATYLNHAFLLTGGGDLYTNARRTGMQLIGPNSTLKNSEIRYAGCQGMWIGEACRVENNLIQDINYESSYGAGINFWCVGGGNEGTSNQVITRNTFIGAGRSHIDFSEWENKFPGQDKHFNIEISYNDLSHSMKLSADGGQMYGSVYTWLNGSSIHHNWVHDSDAQHTPTSADVVGALAGVYLDQASGPITLWKNLMWNNQGVDFHTQQNGLPGRDAGRNWVIGNTFATGPYPYNNMGAYLTATTNSYDYWRNNISVDDIILNWGTLSPTFGDVRNSLMFGTQYGNQNGSGVTTGPGANVSANPNFVGGTVFPVAGGVPYANAQTHIVVKGVVTDPEDYFQLTSGSGANEIGTHITGITIPGISDNSVFTADAVGTPDAGAYERTGEVWIPGYNSVAPEATVNLEDNNPTFTTYSVTVTTFSNAVFSGGTASFHNTDEAFATINMTGTAFEWYAEKYNNAAIVEVQVDGVRQDCDAVTGGTQDCDLYINSTTNNSTLIFSKTGMSAGSHQIKLINKDKNPASVNNSVNHDVIKITAQ